MNNFKIKIENIQSIKHLELDLDLNSGKVMCIVGKNGVGKTTFIKAIATLLSADIFKKTSSPYIFNSSSKITYHIDGKDYIYTHNDKIQTIDSQDIVADPIKNNIIGELPLPHGKRFNFFQAISDKDKEIRGKYIDKDYKTPIKLVEWYKKIYKSDKFNDLKEVNIKGEKYYFLPQKNNQYIREDYFSSGEYFILSIYRLIQQQKKLIVIDELDISLDAGAQVHLIKELREFCQEKSVTLLFTTHSLAVIKVLEDDELFYLESNKGKCEIVKRSYNYIKGILYQFEGWDKYILTEDRVLASFIKWQLKSGGILNKEYIVIPIGPASSVIALMDENNGENFFSTKNNVISVVDGDQKNNYKDREEVIFLPFKSVEKALKKLYDNNRNDVFFQGVATSEPDEKGKNIYKRMEEKHLQDKIFEFVTKSDKVGVDKFKLDLQNFINQ